MSYKQTVNMHRRLAILRHLEACTDYTSNASILADVLDHVGVTSTRSQVLTELNWLDENGFIETKRSGDFVVATATLSGAEIAQGRSTHPEIQRPSPKA
jgi:hypothetical protein